MNYGIYIEIAGKGRGAIETARDKLGAIIDSGSLDGPPWILNELSGLHEYLSNKAIDLEQIADEITAVTTN